MNIMTINNKKYVLLPGTKSGRGSSIYELSYIVTI